MRLGFGRDEWELVPAAMGGSRVWGGWTGYRHEEDSIGQVLKKVTPCQTFLRRHIPVTGMQRVRLIEIYNCLCDETRLRIVHLLAQDPLCVCHLQQILDLTQVAASKHLAYLRGRGLVESRRHGQWMIYSLPEQRPPELDWQLRCLQDCLPTHPVFREDLKKLRACASDRCWISKAMEEPPKVRATSSKTQPIPQ